MRISDWSSDVCSSDLGGHDLAVRLDQGDVAFRGDPVAVDFVGDLVSQQHPPGLRDLDVAGGDHNAVDVVVAQLVSRAQRGGALQRLATKLLAAQPPGPKTFGAGARAAASTPATAITP